MKTVHDLDDNDIRRAIASWVRRRKGDFVLAEDVELTARKEEVEERAADGTPEKKVVTRYYARVRSRKADTPEPAERTEPRWFEQSR